VGETLGSWDNPSPKAVNMDKRAILLLLLAQFAHAFLGISPNCLHPPCPSPARTSSRSRSSSSSNVVCSLEAPSAAWAASIPPDSGFYRLVTSPTSTSPPKPICYLAESYWCCPARRRQLSSYSSTNPAALIIVFCCCCCIFMWLNQG
jgi:hypothetical protein